MFVHGRAGKFVVPLDVELRAVGNLSALARRGVPFRRAAREHGAVVRPFVFLWAHHGERRLFLAPCGFRRFGGLIRLFRLKRPAHLFFLLSALFLFRRLFRCGFLLFLLLLQAFLPPLLPLDGQRVLAFQFFLLPCVAQRVFLLAALLHVHAEIVDPFGNPHADAAEREARHRHQHDGRREDEHDHAAPDVQRLIQRPRQQRADKAAAFAVQRAHRKRAHQKHAVVRFHAVRGQRRVHAGYAEQLEHGFHKQKNQRAENQRSCAPLFLPEKDEHRARPAEHHRQQQAEHAAQAAHDEHASIQKAAVRRNKLTQQRQKADAEHHNADNAARIRSLIVLSARLAPSAGNRALFLRRRALSRLFRHSLSLQRGCGGLPPESAWGLRPPTPTLFHLYFVLTSMFLFFYFEKTICPRIVRQIIIACLAKSVKVFGHRVAQNQTAQHTVFIHVRLQNAAG